MTLDHEFICSCQPGNLLDDLFQMTQLNMQAGFSKFKVFKNVKELGLYKIFQMMLMHCLPNSSLQKGHQTSADQQWPSE